MNDEQREENRLHQAWSSVEPCEWSHLLLLRELADERVMALALSGLGLTVLCQGKYERAAALCEESLTLSRKREDFQATAASLLSLAIAVLEQGEIERAKVLCEESLSIRRQLEDKGGVAHTLAILGRVASAEGKYEQAAGYYRESLMLRQELGDREGIAAALEGIAGVAGAHGQAMHAARLYGHAEALRTSIGAPLPPPDRPSYQRAVAAVQAQLDEAAFDCAWQTGRTMSLDVAIATLKEVEVRWLVRPATDPSPGAEAAIVSQQLPSRENAFGLTAREREILRLVTRGLTTPQIAERLIISPRTAEAHIRSIYSKLEVTSRSAATRTALEHHLI